VANLPRRRRQLLLRGGAVRYVATAIAADMHDVGPASLEPGFSLGLSIQTARARPTAGQGEVGCPQSSASDTGLNWDASAGSLIRPERLVNIEGVSCCMFLGTKDEWTPVELAERFAAAYRSAGGVMDLELLEGERHTFVNEHPFAPNSVKTVDMVKAFMKKYGSKRQAQR
jgi:hypothetical protein